MNRQKVLHNSHKSTSNAESVLDFIPDLYFRISMDGVILDQKSASTEDLYLPRESILGKNLREVLPGNVADIYLNAILCIQQEYKQYLTIEYSLPLSKGTQHFEAKITPLDSEQVIALVRNITDRKLLEERLLKYHQQLQERVSESTEKLTQTTQKLEHEKAKRERLEQEILGMDRLHLVGEFAAMLGHEIRNPMTTIKGFLQILKTKNIDHSEYLDIILSELDSINHTLSEFILLVNNGKSSLKDNNLNTVITTMLPVIKANALCHQQRVHVKLGTIPNVMLDQNQIRRLIINLTNNGFESMPANGNLYLTTIALNRQVHLIIRDEGPGIPQNILNSIGTPFLTTKKNGTGLGLTICYNIAKRHNAEIKVNSCANGTTFTVQFPML